VNRARAKLLQLMDVAEASDVITFEPSNSAVGR
jgi:hypothetical protein